MHGNAKIKSMGKLRQRIACLWSSFMKIKKAMVSVTGDALCYNLEFGTPVQLVLIIVRLHATWKNIHIVETFCDIDIIEILKVHRC